MILFLDIDFVLNSPSFDRIQALKSEPYVPYYSDIDPETLNLLSSILNQVPELKIVISSSWRDDLSLEDFHNIFSSFGFDSNRIIGTTEPLIDKAESIRKYLKENIVSKYVILDDDALFKEEDRLFPRFYRLGICGLRDSDVLPILKKLLSDNYMKE